MSNKKRGKSATGNTGPSKWDSAIASIEFNEEDSWEATTAFVIGNHVEDNEFINILGQSIQTGQRKLFTFLSKEELYKNVVEFGNPKAKKGKEAPVNFEVCEPCKSHLDAGEDIPLPLLAKLIKFKLLWIKSDDQKKREAEKKGAQATGKGGKKGDKGGKPERKSAKGKGGGKRSPEPPTIKEATKLYKRGEDDPNAEFIDDEPEDGSQKYIIITGFNYPQLLPYMAEIGIAPNVVIKLKSADYNYFLREKTEEELLKENDEKYRAIEEEKRAKEKIERANLTQFWLDLRLVLEGNSLLRDVSVFEYTVDALIVPKFEQMMEADKKSEFGFAMFDRVADLLYQYLDRKRQWKTYLSNQTLLPIPQRLPLSAQPEEPIAAEPVVQPVLEPVDMRHYNELLDGIPDECISPELVLHAMLDQVDAQSSGIGLPSQQEDIPEAGTDPKLCRMLGSLALKLSLTDEEKKLIETELMPPKTAAPESGKVPLLVHPSDDISLRTHFLKKNSYFVPRDAELRLLNHLEPISRLKPPPLEQNGLCEARLARLQQLIFFCSQGGLSYTDIDHAFRQFVFEYLQLTTTDPHGYVIRGVAPDESVIPWDDPYPFFDGLKDISVKEEEEFMAASKSAIVPEETTRKTSRSSSQHSQHSSRGSDEHSEQYHSRSGSPGILKKKDENRETLSRQSSVHFTEDAIEKSIKDSPLATPPPARANEDVIKDISEGQKRSLEDRCFAENLEPHVLMQVLRSAIHTLPYMDVYYHMRDNSMFVVLHNPFSPESVSNHWQWQCWIHSNVGLRDFIEYVSFGIQDWLKIKDALYSARFLNSEIERGIKADEEAAKKTALEEKKNAKAKGGKNARSRSASKSRDASPEKEVGDDDLFIRDGSLKALKKEQERIQREKEEEERKKNEKRSKSAQKRAEKEKAAEVDKKKGSRGSAKGKKSPRTQSKEDKTRGENGEEDGADKQASEIIAYDLQDILGHVSGEITHMFPVDGGTIRCERTDFVHGSHSIRTSVFKDGHVFSVHVTDPVKEVMDKFKVEPFPGQKLEETLEQLGDDSSRLNEANFTAPMSYFGSITARMSDGLCLALSSYGGNGEPHGARRPEPKPYVPPAPTRDPSPETAAQPVSRGKKGKSSAQDHAEPEPIPENSEINLSKSKIDETDANQNFQGMYISCTDGQLISFSLEQGNENNEKRLLAKVQFPSASKRRGEHHKSRRAQFDELSRIITLDGTVIRTLCDGSTQILHPDGAVSEGKKVNKTPVVTEEELQATKKSDALRKSGKKAKSGGDVNQEAEAAEDDSPLEWTHTNAQGERALLNTDGTVKEALVPLQSAIATDPSTGEVMYSREDKVVIVHWAEADIVVVEHADGTRITNFSIIQPVNSPRSAVNAETGEAEMSSYEMQRFSRIECPGYASFLLNFNSGEIELSLGGMKGNSVFAASPMGIYHLYHAEGGQVSIHEDGTFLYTPRMVQETAFLMGNGGLHSDGVPTYSLRHNADIVCEVVDPEGNVFSVDISGNSHVMVSAGGEEEEYSAKGGSGESPSRESYHQSAPTSGLHAPRMFMIRSDGSGTELLRYVDVAEYLNDAERDPNAAVIKQEVQDSPQVVATTVIRPIVKTVSDLWSIPYIQESIVPKGLRSRDLKGFPDHKSVKERLADPGHRGLGRNVKWGQVPGEPSDKGPQPLPPLLTNAIEFRQILQYTPVVEESRLQLRDRLKLYAEFVQDRLQQDEDMRLQDPRSEEEQEMARRLAEQVTRVEIEDPALVFQKATAPPVPVKPPTPKAKRSAADWERDRRELEEEKLNKQALKQKAVPNYFKSEFSRDFLLSQIKAYRPEATDVYALAKKLEVFPPSEPVSRSHSVQKGLDDNVAVDDDVAEEPKVNKGDKTQDEQLFTRTKGRVAKPKVFNADRRHEKYPYYSSKQKAHLLDMEDQPTFEGTGVQMPAYLRSGRPDQQKNLQQAKVEDPVRRKLYTTSVVGGPLLGQLGLRRMRGLNVLPTRVDFGLLKEGNTYSTTLHLINTGVEPCRWRIVMPPPATGIRLLYEAGPIAAGMRREIVVEVYAIAAGVEGASGVGSLSHNLELVSEADILAIPITARVMTSYEYEKHEGICVTRGVHLVSTRPPSRDGIIRPRRADTGLSLKSVA